MAYGDNYSKIPSDPMYSTMSSFTGAPPTDPIERVIQLLSMFSGPRPVQGSDQTIRDASLMATRTRKIMEVMQNSFSSQQAFKSTIGGLNPNGIIPFLFSSPNNPFNQTFSNVLGGNPVNAALAFHTQLTGMGMSGFGHLNSASVYQTNQLMDKLQKNFYMPDSSAINYRNSQGFLLEQVAGMGGSVIANRQFGLKGDTPDARLNDFFKQGGIGMASAARSVFGDLPGQQLMQEVRSFFGNDVGLQTGNVGKAEEFLRTFKAAAREAGIALNVMKEMQQTMSQVFSQNPSTMGLAGGGAARATMSAINTVAGFSTTINDKLYMQMGGESGLMQKAFSAATVAPSQPINQFFAAAAGIASFRGNGAVMNDIRSYSEGDMTFMQARDAITSSLGMSEYAINHRKMNPVTMQTGWEAMGDLSTKVQGKAYAERFAFHMQNTLGADAANSLRENMTSIINETQGGVSLSEAFELAAAKMPGVAEKVGYAANAILADAERTGAGLEMFTIYAPKTRAAIERQKERVAEEAKLDRLYDATYGGGFNTNIQRITRAILSGDDPDAGFFESIKKEFLEGGGNDAIFSEYEETLKNAVDPERDPFIRSLEEGEKSITYDVEDKESLEKQLGKKLTDDEFKLINRYTKGEINSGNRRAVNTTMAEKKFGEAARKVAEVGREKVYERYEAILKKEGIDNYEELKKKIEEDPNYKIGGNDATNRTIRGGVQRTEESINKKEQDMKDAQKSAQFQGQVEKLVTNLLEFIETLPDQLNNLANN